MEELEKLLHRFKQHKHNGKKVLSIDYIIHTIEKDMSRRASRKPVEALVD